jgi:hypothetical protein
MSTRALWISRDALRALPLSGASKVCRLVDRQPARSPYFRRRRPYFAAVQVDEFWLNAALRLGSSGFAYRLHRQPRKPNGDVDMFRKTILTAATIAVALVAFQPAAQAKNLKIQIGGHGGHGGHWGHGGHGGWGHGGHGGWGHGGWGHGGHGGFGCFFVKKKYWHKGHHHFHTKNVKVCY